MWDWSFHWFFIDIPKTLEKLETRNLIGKRYIYEYGEVT